MKWKDLSNEAKNVLEWLDPPYGVKKDSLKIVRNELFKPCMGKTFVTDELFKEIIKFCSQCEYLIVVEVTDNYIIIKESSADNI